MTSSRRARFLGSVAALGLVVVGAGAGAYQHVAASPITAPARAAEAVQHPAGFADLVVKVKPAVVAVQVKMDAAAAKTTMNDQQNGTESPMQKFFRQFDNRSSSHIEPHTTVTGVGSGFFISADGYVVTNNHVVDHASSVQVTTDEGTIYTARVVGTDPTTDLALIKVDGKNDFPYVRFADHAPRIGDWAVAVGNPFGLGGTVTAGIVSANARDIGSGPYDYMQIDAPINKGNSGGPTFDLNGNVIGVNTAIFSPSGGSVGIGFDVPAETAKTAVADLKDKGHVTRGWIGVQIQSITPAIGESLGMKQARGAIVDEPQVGSPAAKAGIQSGDVITSINGATVKDSRDVARKIGTMAPGTSAKFDIMRNGQSKTVTVTLAERPNEQQANVQAPNTARNAGTLHLGLSLAPAGEVAGSGNEGVVVTAVVPGGPAADHGFKVGDVILDVGGKVVGSVSDVRTALTDARVQGNRDILMRVKSADATRYVALPLGSG